MDSFKDWRTTVPGLISSFFGFVAFSAGSLHWPAWVVALSAFVSAGGLAWLGISARSAGH
jgi:hypothetical protein